MPLPPLKSPGIITTPIHIDGKEFPVIEIRSTGDVILEVLFENSNACSKSIPGEALKKVRLHKKPIPSPRVFYRVRLETLKKNSRYFEQLLGTTFAEGIAIEDTWKDLAKSGLDPTKVEADRLPRIKIVEEDVATKTFGRETIFCDMLRVIHGAVR
jgi:hypothetical protein